MTERFLDAQQDGFGCEKPFLDLDRFGERVASMLRGGGHQSEQCTPINGSASRQVRRMRVEQAQFVGGDEHEPGFVQPPAAGAAEHLHDFVGLQQLFGFLTPVRFSGEGDAAEGKIDTGGQAHGGDDHPELARLGQRFDHSGAGAVAQTAVVKGDAAFEEFGQVLAHDEFLVRAELKGVRIGQLAREIGGNGLGSRPPGGEDQDRAEVFGKGLGDQSRPVAANFSGHVIAQTVGMNFFERDGPFIVPDQNGFAAKTMKPFDDFLWISDAATQQQ